MEELKQEWQEFKKYSTLTNWLAAIGIAFLLATDWAMLLMGV